MTKYSLKKKKTFVLSFDFDTSDYLNNCELFRKTNRYFQKTPETLTNSLVHNYNNMDANTLLWIMLMKLRPNKLITRFKR